MAFVVSDCREERAPLQAQVLAQATHELGWHGLRPVRTIVEKRATFACTPALLRPGVELAPGLFACGEAGPGWARPPDDAGELPEPPGDE